APSLEEISNELPNVSISKINIDENPMTPSQFGVRGIPTMVLFKNGEVVSTKVGALPKNAIIDWINSSLA
ncbi:MAG: thiol reductase thioredoxin, partial [Sphingomonadales bacterium]|nr:thiol reductase thioredoxin [Sphingomonadales bacterium]